MKAIKSASLYCSFPIFFSLLICFALQSFAISPAALRQGDVKKFNYKEYTFIVRESGGRNHISIKKGIAEKKLMKPLLSYKNDAGNKVSQKLQNITTMFIIDGDDEALIWLMGEGPDGVTPSFSGFYNLKGELISYAYTLRVSSTKARLLNRKGDQKSTLEGYCINNFEAQINNENTFKEQVGLW